MGPIPLKPLTLLIALVSAPATATEPQTLLPVGAIVPFMPQPQAGEYHDDATLRDWLKARGWAICDGKNGTPDLHNRFLQGTERLEDAGTSGGDREHRHGVTARSGREIGRERVFAGGKHSPLKWYPDGHVHEFSARSDIENHLPPFTKVMFIMKIRE
jgi:hypothetical protein